MLPSDELAALLERIPDIVWRYRLLPEPAFEYVSPSVFAVTGYTPEEHYADPKLGQRIVHPDDAPLLEEILGGAAERRPFTVRWRHRQGRVFATEQRITVVRDGDGQVVALEGVGRPITELPPRTFRVRAGDLVLDLAGHRVLVAGRVVELTPAEHRILALLAVSDGPVDAGQLVVRLWGAEHRGGARAVQVHVSNLRQKIEDDARRPQRLLTHRGVGYALAR